MKAPSFYELREPTEWASPPTRYSFSSLQAVRTCPRRWQLVHSRWGEHSTFPERPHPAAIEGQIVHHALDLLAGQLGKRGRPPIGSSEFRAAVESCGFWECFDAQVEEWNRKLTEHPRAGPWSAVRAEPRELANRAVRLLRASYRAGTDLPRQQLAPPSPAGAELPGDDPSKQLQARGILSELRLEHPTIPVAGVLDMVVLRKDGSVAVIDYKTGARKASHEEQLLLYALLWWRVTGCRPSHVAAQYLDSEWELQPTEADLLSTERAVAEEIGWAADVLAALPAPAKPGETCRWCPVRARCDEGWQCCEHAWRKEDTAPGGAIDIEMVVASEPAGSGFVGTRPSGEEFTVVFDATVGHGLPAADVGDRFRIVGARRRPSGGEIELLPWTELYRV